jgi:hypothetical protein
MFILHQLVGMEAGAGCVSFHFCNSGANIEDLLVMLQITSKSLQDEVNLFTIPKKSALELK